MPAVWTGGVFPVALMAFDAATGALGANPVQRALLQTGVLTLALLVLSLACTPLRRVSGWTWTARVRRPLGLLAFGYGVLHFLIYLADHGFSPSVLLADVVKRPFITSGFAALALLVPLALTSTAVSVRRLGFVRWRRLHRLSYAAAALGALHFWWGVKKDHSEPLAYAAVLAVLLAARLQWTRSRLGRRADASRAGADSDA